MDRSKASQSTTFFCALPSSSGLEACAPALYSSRNASCAAIWSGVGSGGRLPSEAKEAAVRPVGLASGLRSKTRPRALQVGSSSGVLLMGVPGETCLFSLPPGQDVYKSRREAQSAPACCAVLPTAQTFFSRANRGDAHVFEKKMGVGSACRIRREAREIEKRARRSKRAPCESAAKGQGHISCDPARDDRGGFFFLLLSWRRAATKRIKKQKGWPASPQRRKKKEHAIEKNKNKKSGRDRSCAYIYIMSSIPSCPFVSCFLFPPSSSSRLSPPFVSVCRPPERVWASFFF